MILSLKFLFASEISLKISFKNTSESESEIKNNSRLMPKKEFDFLKEIKESTQFILFNDFQCNPHQYLFNSIVTVKKN